MTARIIGTGAALPPVYDQARLWDDFFAEHLGGGRAAERIFTGAGVRHRHSVIEPAELATIATMSTGERMRLYTELAPPLGHQAVAAALADAGLTADDIGLLAVASCTGYGTPGLDIALAASLPLRPEARRLLVGHMGCHAALPALASVTDYVIAQQRPAVLLCLELTTIHLQPEPRDIEQIVTHALFGDAATALVLRPDDGAGPGLRVLDVVARSDTARSDQMTWDVTDLGFRMGLSTEVPDALREHVGPLVKDLLNRHGLDISEVGGWAVHPGGPRILDAVEDGLGLDPAALAASRTVLAEHGNCSSATVLLVLRAILDSAVPPGPIVAIAFGPGLTLYAALLELST
ncbi:type III polyketide synthase [Glycomyces buryatensis]|uniref:Type III polyketide synthase n=1 Tax=Glycomyces buryatensis TaxID=2570927 RepID=A0A4S8QFP6_9ACTN|nr:3-oxoacyl-[acyl-carrier-protein] synthase III C-terminal domain-containing protein [Glycomyces buryatensis]THV42501.1 type III polyketide synthase [Glycomyces buryatensis]